MGFSTRTHYGTRAMLELAMRVGEGPVQLERLAELQQIPPRYLAKLAQELRRAGLIRSVRGAHGGYMLAADPDEIEVMDIVRCLDGSVAPTECVESPKVCENSARCVTHEVWAEVNDAIHGVLEAVTLQDLVDRARRKQAEVAEGAAPQRSG
jgi:Rrf2 family protein